MRNFWLFLRKLLGIYKGENELVVSQSGTWNIQISENNVYNDYCHFDIYYNDYTKKYTLKIRGYKPESHKIYPKVFKAVRMLNEGIAYVRAGEVYSYNGTNVNETTAYGKPVNTLNETECTAYLNKAIEEEDYELAEVLKKRLKDLES